MISKTLSTSVCYARLFDECADLAEFAQSLYPLLVAHADDFGREQGDTLTVKYRIHPRSPRPEADFARAMLALSEVGLIHWYEVKGRQCYQIVKFDEHQSGLHKRTRSLFPPVPGNSGKVPEVPAQLKGRELNRTERKGTERKGTEAEIAATLVALSAFDAFWARYPNKAGKQNARKAWIKLAPSADLIAEIGTALDWQTTQPQWTKDGGSYVPHASTWLNGRRWEDEPFHRPQDADDPNADVFARVLGGPNGDRR